MLTISALEPVTYPTYLREVSDWMVVHCLVFSVLDLKTQISLKDPSLLPLFQRLMFFAGQNLHDSQVLSALRIPLLSDQQFTSHCTFVVARVARVARAARVSKTPKPALLGLNPN